MSSPGTQSSRSEYNVLDPASHALHECNDAAKFLIRFEAATGHPLEHVADEVVQGGAPKAIFLVGSIPLGMGTRSSDIDLIVLVDGREALATPERRTANSDQRAAFSNESDPLLAGEFLTLHAGILVDLQVVMTPAIHRVYERLRLRGPELSEIEVRTLGRLRTGWLLWETDNYLARNEIPLSDPSFAIYCCTRNFVTALTHQRKAGQAIELEDLPLALQLGRASVEMAYLAYFASEGFAHLGAKWLAQIGFARGARARLAKHPLLAQGIELLFPALTWTAAEARAYLERVAEFLTAMRGLIEQRLLFRIAFKACAQIESA